MPTDSETENTRLRQQLAELIHAAKQNEDKLKRFELLERFGSEVFHPTLGAAVDDYLADHAVDWRP